MNSRVLFRLVSRWRLALTVTAMAVLLAGGGVALMSLTGWFGQDAKAETVREYTLEIAEQDIDYGGGAVWHAWTYNGTVPGPLLKLDAGETLRVRVINRSGMMASFHAHLEGFSLENDGSHANMITGVGSSGIIPPAGEYTYEFRPSRPGLFPYHSHFADKGIPPSQAVRQGLYGAIVVADPKEPVMREEALFMGEMGHATEGRVPIYVMNGMGLPGGEVALMEIFNEQGLEGVTRQFNKTVPAFKARVNEPLKLHVLNMGDVEHSLYIHSADYVSLGVLGGRPWPGKVVPLVAGSADTLLVTFKHPGLWLFHCHVESHADAGMIGVFMVEQ